MAAQSQEWRFISQLLSNNRNKLNFIDLSNREVNES